MTQEIETSFLVQIWGEDIDHALTAIVPDWEGVRRFCVEFYVGSEDHTTYSGENTLDLLKAEFDEHEEDERGGAYEEQWEIGGIRIERITDCSSVLATPPAEKQAAPSGGATMVDYIGACPICHGNRAAYPQAPSGQQAEATDEQLSAMAKQAGLEPRTNFPGEKPEWVLSPRDLRAVLALAGQQSERPAQAGQAVVIRALTMARHALVNLRINKSAESLALANALDEALAGQQSERPAPAGQPRPFAEVVQHNQGRYFTCLAAPGVDQPEIGAKVYLAAPAGQAVGDELDLIESVLKGYPRSMAQADALRTITKLRAMLAASQAERPAVKEGDNHA